MKNYIDEIKSLVNSDADMVPSEYAGSFTPGTTLTARTNSAMAIFKTRFYADYIDALKNTQPENFRILVGMEQKLSGRAAIDFAASLVGKTIVVEDINAVFEKRSYIRIAKEGLKSLATITWKAAAINSCELISLVSDSNINPQFTFGESENIESFFVSRLIETAAFIMNNEI